MRHIVLSQALFLWVIIASPVGAEWLFEYNVNYLGDGHAAGFSSATSGVGHARGVVAIGEDDFFFSNSGRPTQAQGNYNALIYRNCTGATDIPIILEPAWVNPTNPNDPGTDPNPDPDPGDGCQGAIPRSSPGPWMLVPLAAVPLLRRRRERG